MVRRDHSKPDIEIELEKISVTILDKIDPLFEDPKLEGMIPRVSTVIKQLSRWGIFEPYSLSEVYQIYEELSREVHVRADKIDIDRRLRNKKEIFEVNVIPKELENFLKVLHKAMDICIVVELNILSDWIFHLEHKTKLRKELAVLKNLELEKSSRRLLELVEK